MARQLNPDEKLHFALALKHPEVLIHPEDPLRQNIEVKRDTALRLSPELQAWFEKEFLPWSES